MGKKAREKKARREAAATTPQNGAAKPHEGAPAAKPDDAPAPAPGPQDPLEVGPDGDLRLVDLHVQRWIKGEEGPEAALLAMGRDASHTVVQIAEQLGDEKLKEFGRRLAAVRPRVDTNFWALRAGSVERIILDAKARGAKPAFEAGVLKVPGYAVALFDPILVLDALVKGGRPRNEIPRVARGDITWFARPGREQDGLRFTLEPARDGEADLRLRLRVQSGIVFVGPPEASDGPRLGTLRLDPFRTQLDGFVDQGTFVAVPPGVYRVEVIASSPGEIRLALVEIPKDEPPEPEKLIRLALAPPGSASGGEPQNP